MAGVLSGGTRYFGAQPSNTYGTSNFYQPLFLFWDQIVANNPYVYAGNKAGDGNWEDGSHWISLMDPNYMIDRNGALVNDLPDTPALGVSGNTVKFGNVCFLGECEDLSEDDEATSLPTGSGTALYISGGPGSTNFVPNNVSANPKGGIKAHYYDVTLSAAGTTTLSSNATVDAHVSAGEPICQVPQHWLQRHLDKDAMRTGGGFGGASCARFIRHADPRIQVTLIEPDATFTACPFSNEVIAGT